MSCPVCGKAIVGFFYAFGVERLCHACWVWSLRARAQLVAYGRVRKLAPETLVGSADRAKWRAQDKAR